MICPQCGAANEDSANFCLECGSPLRSSADEQPAASEQQPAPAQSYAAPQPPADAPTQPVSSFDAAPTQPADSTSQTVPAPAQPTAAPAQPQPGMVPPPPPPSAPGVSSAPASAVPPQSDGKATGALVCGILAIIFSGSVLLGIVLGIVAIVLAGKALDPQGGKAKGGKICGIVGLVLSILALILYFAFGALLAGIVAGSYSDPQISSAISSAIASSDSSSASSKSASTSSSAKQDRQDGSSSAKSSSQSKSASDTSSSTLYQNSRYGYSLFVPSSFGTPAESANGDGATWTDPDTGMKVVVSGSLNSNQLDGSMIEEMLWNGTSDVKTEAGSNYVMLRQYDGDQGEYYLVYYGDSYLNTLQIIYDASKQSELTSTIEEIADSFTPAML